ncbi:class I SAM-dependent methyltransferase [Bradyrhizobium sp. INPA03-11B]|uniref:class I SAM-dependent methyltransferase n=1 Tax=Bradyrhizobium sp. INPA03-11B TaxID=418598 RepID=UPI00338FB3F0
MLARSLDRLLPTLKAINADVFAKRAFEFAFWMKLRAQQRMSGIYEPCFTQLVDLALDDYRGKRVLDIGCGPLGTLEWADMTIERVGLDPLANLYQKLGTDSHKMTYVTAHSESIPYPDGHFDIVSCFNALDHVDDLDQTIAEIKRVVAKGGIFLLGVDTNHAATIAEPITIDWGIGKKFHPEMSIEVERHYERSSNNYIDVMNSKAFFDHADPRPRPGIIILKLRKVL